MSKKTKRHAKQPAPTGKLQLLGIRLVESMSRFEPGELRETLPGHATQAINATSGFSDNEKAAFVNLKIKLDVTYDGDKAKPVISILASFIAEFTILEPHSDKETFNKFLNQIGLLGIWPYWREFVQSMTTRMGLPAFPVPLINIAALPGDKNKTPGGD